MISSTIDDVIARLEEIIAECTSQKNPAGYFAALYFKVTCAVRDGIRKGEFEDNARMEKLDVVFAQRYVDAWDAWKEKGVVSASWNVAFNQTKKTMTIALQHLLLGMNAHINLDLGIAAAGFIEFGQDPSLRRDFIRINTILSSLMLDVLKDIQRISPLLSLLGLHAQNARSMLINFTIESARDGAWCFAEELAAKDADQVSFIKKRDQDIQSLGLNLVSSKGLMRITLLVIRLFEWNNPAKVIEALKGSAKTKFHSANAPVGSEGAAVKSA